MSPAVGRDGHRLTHSITAPNGVPSGGRDSFLNYFFGKDGVKESAQGLPGQSAAGAMPGQIASRHVSQNLEPSISGSFRRGNDARLMSAPEPIETDLETLDLGFLHDDASAPALTEREALETELIRRLISSYFNIVRETIADQVPKAVMHLLVNHSKDVVQNRLVSELYKEGLFEELLYEDDGIKQEREKCEKLLGTYREAARIVGEVL